MGDFFTQPILMKKIRNPFDPAVNKCFGCSPSNPIGLSLEFFQEDNNLVCYWDPDENMQGYPGVIHGGIQSTLMDELASWVVFVLGKCGGFTSSMEIRFRKPLLVSKGKVKVTGKLIEMNRRIADIETHIYDSDGVLCSTGLIRYFIFTDDQARGRMGLPDHNEFFFT
jgi:uncharacterized protein (TIGR00369 family)